MRRFFVIGSLVVFASGALVWLYWPPVLWSLILIVPVLVIGFQDYFQRKSSVLRNFPIIGHFRFIFEAIRPEISQYFIETETGGRPFSREERSLVYQRAKKMRDTVPFGTIRDVYEVGYEWVNHSMQPAHVEPSSLRVTVGGPDCAQPYSASILNISAMSYGALSSHAILALNDGARMGAFAHNTGEGSISPYHLRPGGDLIWQIGTGYFGCRDQSGQFDIVEFGERATHPHVKMIEIKISQGAKPGHGGILPAAKLTSEIAAIRLVELGNDVISPPAHSAFSTPRELCEFIGRLREASGGKPVGFKLCVGKRREFLAVCKGMLETGIAPDFIAVDGGEGGTGAAPLEFTNKVGAPLTESLIFVHTALTGFGLRKQIRVIASGHVVSAFDLVKRLALGADMCNSARAMMLALGCIQARRCNSNKCPVGAATQDPQLTAGLDVHDKGARVSHYHSETMHAVAELLGAMGVNRAAELRPWHILRRTSPNRIQNYSEIYGGYALEDGSLLQPDAPESHRRAVACASSDSFSNALKTVEGTS